MSENIEQSVRTILLNTWDPLGVGDNPALSDEYDAYVMETVRLFNLDGDRKRFTDALLQFEIEIGGAATNQREEAVRRLVELYEGNGKRVMNSKMVRNPFRT